MQPKRKYSYTKCEIFIVSVKSSLGFVHMVDVFVVVVER